MDGLNLKSSCIIKKQMVECCLLSILGYQVGPTDNDRVAQEVVCLPSYPNNKRQQYQK
jgi:hypothetical protein